MNLMTITRQMAAMVSMCLAAVAPLDAQTFQLDNVPPIALTTSSTTSAISVDLITGGVVVRSSAGNYNQCSIQLPTLPPTINSFAATPSVVEPGATFTMFWAASNVTHCIPTQGGSTLWNYGGMLPPTGSMTLTAPTTPGAVNFQLTCTNGTQTVSATTSVTVPQGQACPEAYPLSSQSSWNGTFNTWPSYNVRRRILVPANTYMSWSFVPTVPGQFGTVVTSEYPFDGDGFGQFSISRSPGCFTQSRLGPGCLGFVNRNSTVSWKVGGGLPQQCALTPGVTYYVNFTYGNSSTGPGPHCPAGPGLCGADVQMNQQD
jgi:hypothetical protein